MSPRYDDDWIAGLMDDQARLGGATPEELLAGVGLSRGQTVVDVGCGPGFLTLPAARVVGSNGLVYAVDIEKRMLDIVRAKGAALNIVTVLSGGGAVPLPDQIADHALCTLLLHDPEDFPGSVKMAEDIGRLVRPGGTVLVIEWVPEEGSDRRRRLAPSETEAILRKAGLEFDAASPLGEKQYVIVARRPAG